MTKRWNRIKYFEQAAFLLGCLFVLGCENDPKSIRALTEKRFMVDTARNIDSYLSENGHMRARLIAPLLIRASATDTPFIEFPRHLHVNFYDSLGNKVESQLDSKYGKYYESLSKVYLRDSVVVFNVKGDTLKCPDLWWDQNSQKFYTDKVVRIHRTGDLIYGGKGMEAKQDLSDIVIKEPTGTVTVNDSASKK
jgi:LPS export ABC transporter protein LptC